MRFFAPDHLIVLAVCLAVNHGPLRAQCTADAGAPIIACEGSTITLGGVITATGQGPFSYSWTPTTGLSSATVPNPILTVPSGISAYQLIVSDDLGCVAMSTVDVTGLDAVPAEFTTSPGTAVCPMQTVLFSDQSGIPNDPLNSASKRIWSIGPGPNWVLISGSLGSMNGQPGDADLWTAGSNALEVQFLDPGNALVSLTVSSDCGFASSSSLLTVGTAPAQPIVASNSPVCLGQTLSMSAAPVNGVSYQWTGPGGSTAYQPSVTIPNASAAQVGQWTVVAISGACASTPATVDVEVTPNPVIAVSPGFTAYCAGGSTTLEAVGAIDYTWYVGGTIVGTGASQSVVPATTTTYTVAGMVNGCSGFASATILVHPVPTASFDHAPEECAGMGMPFTNTSTGATSMQWTFGDAGTSMDLSPTHAYLDPGPFTVSLVATTNAGCSDTAVSMVDVWEMPIADLAMDQSYGCGPLVVEFANGSLGSGLSFAWNFGNGSTSDMEEPVHSFTSPGSSMVSVIASNGGGCSDTAWAEVEVYPSPVSQFTLPGDQSCEAPFTVEPINTSMGADGQTWFFGNGEGSELQQPSVTYMEPGSYSIELATTNAYGCSDMAWSTFTVFPTLIAGSAIDGTEFCAGSVVEFTNTSLNAMSAEWLFGDGAYSVSMEAQHSYEEQGVYDVLLIVTGAGACTDSLLLPGAVSILSAPDADFSMDVQTGVDNTVQFVNASVDADVFVWDFGDGRTSAEFAPLLQFPSEGGDWTICLTAESDSGCSETDCKILTLPSAAHFYAPNTFTPDGDGINDVFNPVLDGYADWSFDLQVYDRWGELIHSSKDRNSGWDGRSKGGNAPSGVYVWRVSMQRAGELRTYPGHITLVR